MELCAAQEFEPFSLTLKRYAAPLGTENYLARSTDDTFPVSEIGKNRLPNSHCASTVLEGRHPED